MCGADGCQSMNKHLFKLGLAITFSYAIALLAPAVGAEDTAGKSERKLLSQLHTKDMKAVHAHAKEILSRCQLPECVIVSLGTTNALVDSFLRYYLKGDAERAIHYVPIRTLRATLSFPNVLARSLPPMSGGLKRVMFVRTLESGLSVAAFADAVERSFAQVRAPYEFEGFFSVPGRIDKPHRFLESKDIYGIPRFLWPYELRSLPKPSAFTGSYRDIDDDYYRFQPVIFNADDFWLLNKNDPRVIEFKGRVERSVGFDKSPAYAAARDAISDQLFAEFQYQENPGYKLLDKAVKLFIERPNLFAIKKCAALVF